MWRVWLEKSFSLRSRLLDVVFPPRCVGCDSPGSVWCESCEKRLHRIVGQLCALCGLPTRRRGRCPHCSHHPLAIPLRSYAWYRDPLIKAILFLKYRPNLQLAEIMADWLGQVYSRTGWTMTRIVPVPLASARQKQRGYNQVGLIASALAERLDLSYDGTSLSRVRDTGSQVGLPSEARWKNVQAAFCSEAEFISGAAVLLVDDLLTTGATLSACSEAMFGAGADSVKGLTVARARAETPRMDA